MLSPAAVVAVMEARGAVWGWSLFGWARAWRGFGLLCWPRRSGARLYCAASLQDRLCRQASWRVHGERMPAAAAAAVVALLNLPLQHHPCALRPWLLPAAAGAGALPAGCPRLEPPPVGVRPLQRHAGGRRQLHSGTPPCCLVGHRRCPHRFLVRAPPGACSSGRSGSGNGCSGPEREAVSHPPHCVRWFGDLKRWPYSCATAQPGT
mmetsp:Transcript_21927/g.57208  ORF Transcript_21927/g.57208 Transcript_21927/m.57208 type:complete len:207 (+) Transcript_21927:131-751(+)